MSSALGRAGLDAVLEPVLHATTPRRFDRLVARTVQAVALSSPAEADAVAGVTPLPPCASLAPDVSAALRRHGIEPWVESPHATFDALAVAIAACLGRPGVS